jgi:hypothetical protein
MGRANIFRLLLDQLDRVEQKTGGNAQLTEYAVAGAFLFLVFGRDWYEQKIAFRDENPDDWMLNGSDAWLRRTRPPVFPSRPSWWRSPSGVWLRSDDNGDIRRLVHNHRVVRLADALFTLVLGKTEGFDWLKERFFSRPTKACFIESEVASLLVYNGLRVAVVKEVGRRGQDFDLLGSVGETTISVEVTSKVEGVLTVQGIRNTLYSKRNQVPPVRPAVLYLHVPGQWMRNYRRAIRVFTRAFREFSLRSRRYNAFVLVWEDILPIFNGGFPQLVMRACYNNRARIPFVQTDLFAPIPRGGQIRCAHSLVEWLRNHRPKIEALSEPAELV